MIKIKKEDSHIARDVDALIASEKLYQNYRELVIAGFTPNEALVYLATLIGYITIHGKKKNGEQK